MQELGGSEAMKEVLNERDGHLLLSSKPKGERAVRAVTVSHEISKPTGNSLFFLCHSLQAQ